MPLQYEGVIAEHNAVRNHVGAFDVSHLGKLRLEGTGSTAALQHALTADIAALEVGRATYALVLTESGGCVDDVFAYRLENETWLVVPNASNVDAVATAITESGGSPVDEWDRWAIIAIQGPDSFTAFEKTFPDARATELDLHQWKWMDVFGQQGLVARTGYTGERGFELYAPAATALEAWRALIDNGVTPVGLGARDTLRLEMGYALYGHEIDTETNPLEAGLGWVLAWGSGFRGEEASAAVKAAGPSRKLVGIECRAKGVPRQGYEVALDDRIVGAVTSGNHSPTLGTGIALALVDRQHAPEIGARVSVRARGREIEGDIVKPPFVRKGGRVDK
jgi:aminomethyltransferase